MHLEQYNIIQKGKYVFQRLESGLQSDLISEIPMFHRGIATLKSLPTICPAIDVI